MNKTFEQGVFLAVQEALKQGCFREAEKLIDLLLAFADFPWDAKTKSDLKRVRALLQNHHEEWDADAIHLVDACVSAFPYRAVG